MDTDTVYAITQQPFLDTMQVNECNILDTIAIDGSVTINNMLEPVHYESHLDSLDYLGTCVSELGICYNDFVSTIAFPLIIAVFAFALPFLFSAINHVNSKYDSAVIANMFKSSHRYKLFWTSIGINVGTMMVYGGLSLLPFRAFHYLMGGILPSCVFVALASWMVVSVFLFMRACMLYNKPQSVIDEIQRCYDKEKSIAAQKDIRQSKKFKKIGKTKSHLGQKVWKQIGSMYERAYSSAADLNYINRLSEMCRYAIRNNNSSLYISVWAKIYGVQKKELVFNDTGSKTIVEDRQKDNTISFLRKTFENIDESVNNVEIQGSLIRTWLQCFAHDKYPNQIDFHFLMRSLFKAAGNGNTRLLEKYFSDCKYSFSYIQQLQQVLYVKGGEASNRIDVEKKSQEIWDEVCDCHFVLAAFAYYMGLKTLPKQMLSQRYGMELLPRNRQELLITYARCKANMTSDGGYLYMLAEDLYGRRVDPDYIDEFAVLLFALLEDSEPYVYFLYANNDVFDKLKECKTIFNKIGEKYKKDSYIKKIHSEVCQVNFNKAFGESYRILQSKPTKESFERSLPAMLTHNIDVHIHNQVSQLKNYTGYEMWGKPSKEKMEEMRFQICPVCFTKHFLEQWKPQDMPYYLSEVSEIMKNRANYLYMQILLSWKCEEISAKPDSIADLVQSIIGGHPEDYVILDYDSHVNNWLSMDYHDINHLKCEGADYVMNGNIGYLKDTFPYKQLAGKMYLIKRDDLPALVRTTDGYVEVKFDDMSNYESNCMDIRAFIDPKYVIRYKRDVKITSFDVVPMNIK